MPMYVDKHGRRLMAIFGLASCAMCYLRFDDVTSTPNGVILTGVHALVVLCAWLLHNGTLSCSLHV